MPLLAKCKAKLPCAHPSPPRRNSILLTVRLLTARTLSSTPCLAQDSSHTPFPRLRDEPDVDPGSLTETLDAHRETNRASLIHYVSGPGHKRQPISVPSRVQARRQPRKRESLFHRVKIEKVPAYSGSRGRGLVKASGDYGGESGDLSRQWSFSPGLSHSEVYPWTTRLQQQEPSATAELSAEIRAFDQYISPSAKEKDAATRTMADLFTCIQYAASSVEIDVVGSRVTGLATPLSDIDVQVAVSDEGDPSDALVWLRYLSQQMRQPHANPFRPQVNPIRIKALIDHAKVPIISGQHVQTGLDFQIQCNGDTFATGEYTKNWIIEYPTLRPLFLVLKQMLSLRGLYHGPSGGLTTYPLIGMIVAALKFGEGKYARDDLARQLLYFLDMYSDIDFYKTGISISPLQLRKKRDLPNSKRKSNRANSTAPTEWGEAHVEDAEWKSILNPSKPFLMSLQDPANKYNDLGGRVFKIKHIQATFITAREKLKEAMERWDMGEEEVKPEHTSRSPLLAWPLGGDYRFFEIQRQDLASSMEDQGTEGGGHQDV